MFSGGIVGATGIPFRAGLRIKGASASILWGHRPAAEIAKWQISRSGGVWRINAKCVRLDAFMLRQHGLLFHAPMGHSQRGFWNWTIKHDSVQLGQNGVIVATVLQME